MCSWHFSLRRAPLPGELPGPIPAETSSGVGGRSLLRDTDGNFNAWLQITNVFCCGTLIKLLFPAAVLWCCEWRGPSPPLAPPSPFRCKSALCSFLIIALHPALGFQRYPGNRVCSGCNLDCTLFVITIATRYNFAVLFKFYEFQCVSHVPVESGAGKRCLHGAAPRCLFLWSLHRTGKAWAGVSV